MKNVPIWRLDTNTLIVTHFNADTLTEEHKTYHTDYIRYHLHYSDNRYPDRLRRFVNEGKINDYVRKYKGYNSNLAPTITIKLYV